MQPTSMSFAPLLRASSKRRKASFKLAAKKDGPWRLRAKGCNDPRLPVSVMPTAYSTASGTSYRFAASVISRSQTLVSTARARLCGSYIKITAGKTNASTILGFIRQYGAGPLAVVVRRSTVMGAWTFIGLAGGLADGLVLSV